MMSNSTAQCSLFSQRPFAAIQQQAQTLCHTGPGLRRTPLWRASAARLGCQDVPRMARPHTTPRSSGSDSLTEPPRSPGDGPTAPVGSGRSFGAARPAYVDHHWLQVSAWLLAGLYGITLGGFGLIYSELKATRSEIVQEIKDARAEIKDARSEMHSRFNTADSRLCDLSRSGVPGSRAAPAGDVPAP